MSIYVPYMNLLQCDQEHWYTYTLHYWHIPWTNMSTVLHIYVQMHYYCSQHIGPTSLHTSIKKQIATFIYHTFAIYVPAT